MLSFVESCPKAPPLPGQSSGSSIFTLERKLVARAVPVVGHVHVLMAGLPKLAVLFSRHGDGCAYCLLL